MSDDYVIKGYNLLKRYFPTVSSISYSVYSQTYELDEIYEWFCNHSEHLKLPPKIIKDVLEQMRKRLDMSTLEHHGIKGQKWGVKNGPPYPLDKAEKHDTIVEDAIRSGEVSTKINREKQLRHTLNGHTSGRSYIYGDLEFAQELVDKYGGKGIPLRDKNGNWLHKEKFDDSSVIGKHVDKYTGVKTETNKGMIVYSKTGTHVYPRKEKK